MARKYTARVDGNQASITAALRKCGALVQTTDEIGEGCGVGDEAIEAPLAAKPPCLTVNLGMWGRRHHGDVHVADRVDGGLRSGHAPPGISAAQRDDLGQDRQRDLLGCAGTDIQARGRVDGRPFRGGEIRGFKDGQTALPAGDESDVGNTGAHGGLQSHLLAVAVRGDDDGVG